MTQPRAEFEKLAEKATQGELGAIDRGTHSELHTAWKHIADCHIYPSNEHGPREAEMRDNAAFIAWCFNNRALIARALAALEERK